MNTINKIFLESAISRLHYYRDLGDKTIAVLQPDDFHFQPNEASNSIAIIIQHLSGNMLSRWTDFLNSDGEKEWRNRDQEFEITDWSKEQLIAIWQKGWACCFDALNNLTENDLEKIITIRLEKLTVVDAIIRQLAHYPYHVGQIIYVARMIKNTDWQSLSIPKNKSQQFNQEMEHLK